MLKNILIYTQMSKFNLRDGRTVIKYNLARILDEMWHIKKLNQ